MERLIRLILIHYFYDGEYNETQVENDEKVMIKVDKVEDAVKDIMEVISLAIPQKSNG